MNRLTLSTMLTAIGLLFLMAGCVVQIRPDGGIRLDLPPLIPITLVASEPMAPTIPVTATSTLTTTPVLTGTLTPTTTLTATATATLVATAPTTATITATITATVPTTATAPMTTTATVTPTGTITATATITTTGTPTVMPSGTVTPPGTGTPPTRTRTPTPPPGTRAPAPTGSTPAPTATTARTSTPSPTRTPTAPGAPPTTTPTGTRQATTTPATPPATPTPIPGTVFLGSHQGYEADGTFYVVGEVINGERFPVFNVKVIASFYDANNNLVGAQESVTDLAQIEPELSSPFKLATPSSGNISRYELTLVWDDVSIVDYEELTILSQEIREEGPREVFGELRNDGSVTVKEIVVVVTFYDRSGAVVDVYQGSAAQPTLARDETTTYTIAISRSDLEYDHFTVQAQGALQLF